ncbi:DAK2 domain-containing protein [Wenjunlia vitaminophila]|uniref:DAK2 domain-containing protein n=1 Tax=Wenjunlia vitaminophila TaxID=76728 RepID=UPI00036B9E85|nr:DAK2 domain-containing protein [Wenjunlia vitaminophila]
MPDTLDAPVVRTWCHLALDALGRAREQIDAINVYPVPDGDTGTNLYLTWESATQAVEAVFTGHDAARSEPTVADTVRALAHGALIGARGNSGVILAQVLRGMSEVLAPTTDDAEPTAPAAGPPAPTHAEVLRRALRRAATSAYQAVARPVEGTVLTVAAAAADAAEGTAGDLAAVAEAAHRGAAGALAETPGLLEPLRRASVVDAGGRGLVVVLAALADALAGNPPIRPPGRPWPPVTAQVTPAGCEHGDPHLVPGGPAFEVTYLLDAADGAVPALRARLDGLGDSLVVVGGGGLWNVHVHVDDAGAAVEAGIEAGRPHRIRITHFGDAAPAVPRPPGVGGAGEHRVRAVVAVVRGEGLARLCAEAGAVVLRAQADEPPSSGELAGAVSRARAGEVVLLPNDAELRAAAGAAAERARQDGVRVAVIPTRAVVQGIAALAVHEPARRFEEDVVAMTAAAGATRHAELTVAERRSFTTAGVCQAGDVLGLVDGDVAVIGDDLTEVARTVLDRMLAAGGELVTLVLGATAPPDLADRLGAHVRATHLAVDTVVYHGDQPSPLLVGVE